MQEISANKKFLIKEKAVSSVYEDSEYYIYWEGLFFINGRLSGEESVKYFINEIKNGDIMTASSIARGVFFILIEDKKSKDIYSFVDNAGLYHAFYTDNFISTSFLELIKNENLCVDDLDPEVIYEFLYFGYLFLDRTFFQSVRKIPHDTILKYSHEDKKIYRLTKNVSSFTNERERNKYTLSEIFKGFAFSLGNQNISVDLTGGFDTRLIVLLFAFYGLKFETACSGGSSDYEDIMISKQVSKELDIKYYNIIHSPDTFETDLKDLFLATEGLYDILYYHRLFQLQKARVSRGITLMISGIGGELFKDFWWLQDFPFYNRKNSNIERLVDLRIMTFKHLTALLTEKYSQAGQNLRDRIIDEVSNYRLYTNTNTYDNIYLNFMMKNVGGRILKNNSYILKCFAPYLDFDIAKIGFCLPRRKRFFNMFHRETITRLNPLVAKIKTSEAGISASSNISDILSDIPKYTNDKIKRLMLKIRKQSKSFMHRDSQDIYVHVRKMKAMEDAVKILQDTEILKQNIKTEDIDNRRLGMILTLAMLINYINSK